MEEKEQKKSRLLAGLFSLISSVAEPGIAPGLEDYA